ncbi:acyltransferase [bacterium]|nr:acyltransferase [bacterium]
MRYSRSKFDSMGDQAWRYRPDVDGLRGIAVLLVLLFHVGFGFPGGYIGVDVFFVISGFLITGLILSAQEQNRFSLAEFWKRRIRRIVPASSFVVLLTLVAGYFLLLPTDLTELAESAIYQQLMGANFFFWHNSGGYFDGPAELKPLLHTWSLAVEEQFYLFYPIALVALGRLSRTNLLIVLVAVATTSFGISWYLVADHPGATFYALPTRAWELLLGGILAACPHTKQLRRGPSESIGIVGFALIVYSSLYFDAGTVFPGPNAMVPCLGAVMVIASSSSGKTLVGRVLSHKLIVFVGLISYSLYLWHWPLLAYQRYWFGSRISLLNGLLVMLGSFVLAWLTWRFVEQPFRRSARLTGMSGKRLVGFLIASSMLMVAIAAWTLRSEGIPNRLPRRVRQVINDASKPDGFEKIYRDAEACDLDQLPLIGRVNDEQQISFVLWGDSHARVVSRLCDDLANEFGIQGVVATKSGTSPLLGKWSTSPLMGREDPRGDREAIAWNDAVLRYLRRNHISNVIIAARWLHCAPADKSPDELTLALRNVYTTLTDNGVQVWIMMQVPEMPQSPARELTLATWAGWSLPLGISEEQHLNNQRQVFRAFSDSGIPNSAVLDPRTHCFGVDGNARLGTRERSFYEDRHHLSKIGASQLLQPLLRPVISQIANDIKLSSQPSDGEAPSEELK